MEITDVKVIPVDDEKLKAFVSIVFDQSFVVTDIKIITGPRDVRVDAQQEAEGRDVQDIAHPLTTRCGSTSRRRS